MIDVQDIQNILTPYGYAAQPASIAHYPLFEADLDDADKYELGRTRYQDWRQELYATLDHSGSTFCVTSIDHGGRAIFGVTPFPGNAGRIWLLQSRSFQAEGHAVHGAQLPYRIGGATREALALFQRHHTPLFNFIPASQTRNIRWLKLAGFEFYGLPGVETDILFFGLGNGARELAEDPRLWSDCLGQALYKRSE